MQCRGNKITFSMTSREECIVEAVYRYHFLCMKLIRACVRMSYIYGTCMHVYQCRPRPKKCGRNNIAIPPSVFSKGSVVTAHHCDYEALIQKEL